MIISLKRGPSGGLDVPLDALSLAWALEARDLTLSVEGEKLRVCGADGKAPVFTEAERAAIVKWKGHLMAIAQYQAPVVT